MTHIPPFWESMDFWVAFLVAAVGGGGLGGLITAVIGRRRTMAERDSLAADAARKAVDILTVDVIQPLRDEAGDQRKRADRLAARVDQLEAEEAAYVSAVRYIRALCHWLDPAVTAIDPGYMSLHPKPRLPDDLRPYIAHNSEEGTS
ncbi:hypothetical protein [Pseudoscardovia radai]|nr:hypothetical protein [Pseudoscardovia radai]